MALLHVDEPFNPRGLRASPTHNRSSPHRHEPSGPLPAGALAAPAAGALLPASATFPAAAGLLSQPAAALAGLAGEAPPGDPEPVAIARHVLPAGLELAAPAGESPAGEAPEPEEPFPLVCFPDRPSPLPPLLASPPAAAPARFRSPFPPLPPPLRRPGVPLPPAAPPVSAGDAPPALAGAPAGLLRRGVPSPSFGTGPARWIMPFQPPVDPEPPVGAVAAAPPVLLLGVPRADPLLAPADGAPDPGFPLPCPCTAACGGTAALDPAAAAVAGDASVLLADPLRPLPAPAAAFPGVAELALPWGEPSWSRQLFDLSRAADPFPPLLGGGVPCAPSAAPDCLRF